MFYGSMFCFHDTFRAESRAKSTIFEWHHGIAKRKIPCNIDSIRREWHNPKEKRLNFIKITRLKLPGILRIKKYLRTTLDAKISQLQITD
jgi:hypothetical protein